ncbi:MAG: DsrE family protein [Candidatus Methanomethylophilaceae archaeon]|nr:DsrE family protein [Candidatus Methanomethylophilaceae archaeon]MDD3379450.1 DsrE family protein [Candidatus Methanomethylophilaceae archaeon]MDY0224066.1 DsrE family protein [Candidatus Methanomethylophilaceae archaeon]
MGILTIQIRSGTMMNMDSNVALKLAKAAIEKGHKVKIFCYGEGVTLIKAGQNPKRFPNVGDILEELASSGVEIVVCETCGYARGIQRGEEIKGTKIGSITNDFSQFVSESDRLVTISR